MEGRGGVGGGAYVHRYPTGGRYKYCSTVLTIVGYETWSRERRNRNDNKKKKKGKGGSQSGWSAPQAIRVELGVGEREGRRRLVDSLHRSLLVL